MTVGTKIKQLRENKKMSQRELAQKIGIEQTTLGSIESGNTKKVDFQLMHKICNEFEVDFDYFIDGKTQENNVKKAEYSNIGCTNGTINLVPEGILENIIKRIEKLENDRNK
jgi:transcriptional regulator with XRE-family HTH domain